MNRLELWRLRNMIAIRLAIAVALFPCLHAVEADQQLGKMGWKP